MIDNRVLFDQAMNMSRAAAERGDWYTAVEAATQATSICPDDMSARSDLAVALYHAAHYARAIEVLEELHTQHPDDLITLAYLTRAYEGNGDADKAVAALIKLGDLAVAQEMLQDALEAFEEAVRLRPDAEQPRIRMAEVLVALGEHSRAAEQCVRIAQQRHASGNTAGAEEALDEALNLDPQNQVAKALKAEYARSSAPFTPTSASEPSASPAEPPNSPQAAHLATQALAHQQAGEITTALQLYKQAIDAGAERPDVWYNLALLHVELGQHDSAITLLHKAASSPEYAVKAALMLGNALRNSGNAEAAIEAYATAIEKVDLATIGRAEVNEVIDLYHAASDVYAESGDAKRAASLCESLAGALQQKRWGREFAEQQRARVKQFTQLLMTSRLQSLNVEPQAPAPAWSKLATLETLRTTGALPAADVDPFAAVDTLLADNEQLFAPVTPLDVSGCDEIVQRLIDASGRFAEQGLVWAAIDACHEVIRHDPAYLPIHLRLSEIYERQGRVEDALIKYRALIDTYNARNCAHDAVTVYERMIELAPDDLDARAELVALLRETGRIDEATQQAIVVANTAFRLGQTSRALAEFEAIHTWAAPSATLHIEHGRALLKLERWNDAYEQFRQATGIAPHNTVALALESLTLALIEQPSARLWDAFARLLGQLTDDAQQHAAVQAEYRLALLLADRPVHHFLLGLLQQAAQQHDLALLSLEQALSLVVMDERPSFAPVLVHQAMATSYLAQKQAPQALDHLYTVQRLLREQPMPAASPHAFARALTAADVEHMIAVLRKPESEINSLEITHKAQEVDRDGRFASPTPASTSQEPETVEAEEALGITHDLDMLLEQQQQAQALLRRGKVDQGLALLHQIAASYHERRQIERALGVLFRAAETAWMLGQHESAARMIEQGTAWAPQYVGAWQQQAHLRLLLDNLSHAIEAQRQALVLAEEQYDETLPSIVQQLLVLAPDDAQAGRLHSTAAPEQSRQPALTPVA